MRTVSTNMSRRSKILKQAIYVVNRILCCCLFLHGYIAIADTYPAQSDKKLQVAISKSGLNRISNPPYRITQVTGDDSKFRLKYDEDGSNIYLMPLAKIGENIEISIRNNAGFVQDLELQVSDIKGKSIIIDGKVYLKAQEAEKTDIAQMLRAMKDNVSGKFYVQECRQKLGNIGTLRVEQTKIYKYKNLVGGVFVISNQTKEPITLDVTTFAGRFDNVKSSYPGSAVIEPKGAITALVVQKTAEK